MRNPIQTLLLPAILALSMVACGSGEDEVDPAQACNDLRDATINAFVACGGEEMEIADAFDLQIDCSEIKAIKEQDALYDDCIPGLETQECGAALAGEAPDSCSGQLQR